MVVFTLLRMSCFKKLFWLCCVWCGCILIPQPGIEATSPDFEGRFSTTGLAREVPSNFLLKNGGKDPKAES